MAFLSAGWRPGVLAILALAAAAYLAVCRRRGWQAALFLAGLAVLGAAAASPLDLLARRQLFAARMLRDALIIYAAVPLLLHGTPGRLWRPLLRRPAVRLPLSWLVRPLPAAFLFNFGLAVYLFPPLLDRLPAGLPLEAVLALAATLMWWPVLSPSSELPPLSEPLRLVYLLLNWLVVTAIFALVTFGGASHPLDAQAPHPPGLPPTADQELGGVALGVVSHLAYAAEVVLALVRWFRSENPSASPLTLYRRLRAAGFSEREARAIVGLPLE